MDKRTWGGSIPDTFPQWSQEINLSHAEDWWRGTQKHKGPSPMPSGISKALILKIWLFDFLFWSKSAHAKTSYLNKHNCHTSKWCFWRWPPWFLNCYLSKRKVWRKGMGEGVRNYTYSNDVFIFQQLYNKNLCDAGSDLTKNSHRKPAPLQAFAWFSSPNMLSFVYYILKYMSAQTTHRIR